MKPAKEQRVSPREMCSDFVQIAWLDPNYVRVSDIGLLEDVSPEDLCINLEQPVPLGSAVHVHTKGFEGEAEVRYCKLGDYGYLVGVEFEEGCGWEREKWRPKHLYGPVGCGS